MLHCQDFHNCNHRVCSSDLRAQRPVDRYSPHVSVIAIKFRGYGDANAYVIDSVAQASVISKEWENLCFTRDRWVLSYDIIIGIVGR